jgi:hypothetical protein
MSTNWIRYGRAYDRSRRSEEYDDRLGADTMTDVNRRGPL